MLTPVAPPLYTKVICFVCLDTRMVSGWDHEISPGTMRILTMRPRDPLVVGGGGGAKTFTMRTSHGTMRNLTVRPWDFSWYHEMFSWWNFCPLPLPPPREGLLVSWWDFSWYHEISHGLTMRYLMVTMWYLMDKMSLQEVHGHMSKSKIIKKNNILLFLLINGL